MDVDGILHVKTRDRGSGRQAAITVAAMRERLSQEQISEAQERLAEATPAVELDEAGQALVDRAHKLLEGGSLDEAAVRDVQDTLSEIEEARRLADEPELKNWLDELADLLYDLED